MKLLLMAAVFQLSDGLQVGALGALRGLKDTRVPLIINVISYLMIGLPGAYLLGIRVVYGQEGVWSGIIAGLSVAAILHNLRFYLLTCSDRPIPMMKTPTTEATDSYSAWATALQGL